MLNAMSAAPPPFSVSDDMLAFLAERHLATLTLVRPDGRPHVTPVGFTWDPEARLVRVITWNASVKARLLGRHGPVQAAVSQVDGGRWATLSGLAIVTADAQRCALAVSLYAQRYSQPNDRGDDRRAIELAPTSLMGRA